MYSQINELKIAKYTQSKSNTQFQRSELCLRQSYLLICILQLYHQKLPTRLVTSILQFYLYPLTHPYYTLRLYRQLQLSCHIIPLLFRVELIQHQLLFCGSRLYYSSYILLICTDRLYVIGQLNDLASRTHTEIVIPLVEGYYQLLVQQYYPNVLPVTHLIVAGVQITPHTRYLPLADHAELPTSQIHLRDRIETNYSKYLCRASLSIEYSYQNVHQRGSLRDFNKGDIPTVVRQGVLLLSGFELIVFIIYVFHQLASAASLKIIQLYDLPATHSDQIQKHIPSKSHVIGQECEARHGDSSGECSSASFQVVHLVNELVLSQRFR